MESTDEVGAAEEVASKVEAEEDDEEEEEEEEGAEEDMFSLPPSEKMVDRLLASTECGKRRAKNFSFEGLSRLRELDENWEMNI